jgi:hypothetical protein
MAATVAGSLIAQLLADAILCVGTVDGGGNPVAALVPTGPYKGEIPPEKVAPPALSVADKVEKTQWTTTTAKFEDYKVTITAYASQSSATVGGDDPSEAIMNRVEAIVDWDDLGMAGTITIGVRRDTRELTEEKKKAPDGSPVLKCRAEWLVRLWTGP